MNPEISQADLEAYLDEALPPEEMSAIEDMLRNHPEMGRKLVAIHGRRDAGVHTLGEIWRRHRLTCPGRQKLTSYIDGTLDVEEASYITFHLEQVHCRLCVASYEDIRISRQDEDEDSESRRQRFVDSSSTYLRKSDT